MFLRGRQIGVERLSGLDDGVHDRDQFANAGDDRLLVGFALRSQSFVEGLQDGIASIARLRGHVEGLAKRRPATLNVPLAPDAALFATRNFYATSLRHWSVPPYPAEC